MTTESKAAPMNSAASPSAAPLAAPTTNPVVSDQTNAQTNAQNKTEAKTLFPADEICHQMEFLADNRLLRVLTNRTTRYWDMAKRLPKASRDTNVNIDTKADRIVLMRPVGQLPAGMHVLEKNPNQLVFAPWLPSSKATAVVDLLSFSSAITDVKLTNGWLFVNQTDKMEMMPLSSALLRARNTTSQKSWSIPHRTSANSLLSTEIDGDHQEIVVAMQGKGLSDVTVVSLPDIKTTAKCEDKWEPKYFEIRATHAHALQSLQLSRDGSLLATASECGTIIRVWNVAKARVPADSTNQNGGAEPILEFRRGRSSAKISSMAFSPNNKWLAVISDRLTIHLFSIDRPELNQLSYHLPGFASWAGRWAFSTFRLQPLYTKQVATSPKLVFDKEELHVVLETSFTWHTFSIDVRSGLIELQTRQGDELPYFSFAPEEFNRIGAGTSTASAGTPNTTANTSTSTNGIDIKPSGILI